MPEIFILPFMAVCAMNFKLALAAPQSWRPVLQSKHFNIYQHWFCFSSLTPTDTAFSTWKCGAALTNTWKCFSGFGIGRLVEAGRFLKGMIEKAWIILNKLLGPWMLKILLVRTMKEMGSMLLKLEERGSLLTSDRRLHSIVSCGYVEMQTCKQ